MTSYVVTTAPSVLWCGSCATTRAFAPVDCGDGHQECPERRCVECDLAAVLLLAPSAETTDVTQAA